MVQLTIQPAGPLGKKIALAPDLPYVAVFPDPISTTIGDVKKLISVKYPKVRSNLSDVAVTRKISTRAHFRLTRSFQSSGKESLSLNPKVLRIARTGKGQLLLFPLTSRLSRNSGSGTKKYSISKIWASRLAGGLCTLSNTCVPWSSLRIHGQDVRLIRPIARSYRVPRVAI